MKTSLKARSSLIERSKDKLKNSPFLYEIVRFILNPGFRFYPAKRNRLLRELLSLNGARVLNIGSGSKKISSCIVNSDIRAFCGVDVVSDAHRLSFRNEKFDALLMESILEHVIDPFLVIAEAHRVLKKGGMIFVEMPFMYELHQSPVDYYRFTLPGLENLCKDFERVDSGVDIGPTGTLNAVIRNYFALVFSFGNSWLYESLNMFFGILLFPLKVLDLLLIRIKFAQNISSVFYFIGRKKND